MKISKERKRRDTKEAFNQAFLKAAGYSKKDIIEMEAEGNLSRLKLKEMERLIRSMFTLESSHMAELGVKKSGVHQ